MSYATLNADSGEVTATFTSDSEEIAELKRMNAELNEAYTELDDHYSVRLSEQEEWTIHYCNELGDRIKTQGKEIVSLKADLAKCKKRNMVKDRMYGDLKCDLYTQNESIKELNALAKRQSLRIDQLNADIMEFDDLLAENAALKEELKW